MNESEAKKIYNSITNIKDEYIEEAQTVTVKRRSHNWIRWGWGAIAACLCLVAGALLWPKGPQTEVKNVGSLEEITSFYGGDLQAEKLIAPGAKTTGIRLVYVKGGDISDPDDWNTLTITGDYNGRDFTLNCDFDSDGDEKSPAGAYAITKYGDVEVAIYLEESDWSDLFLYRAVFTLDGTAYTLSIHSDSPDDIYAYLNMVLSEPDDSKTPSGAILTDVLGFGVCRVEIEEISPYQYKWHFYVEVDGEKVCVAEQFGYDGLEAWSRDLDGDGVPELICNSTYGDGVQKIIVYRNNNGIIEVGEIRWSYYDEKFGWANIDEGGVASYPVERYDPERGVFTATDYYTNGYDNPVTVEFDDGIDPFSFSPFKHLS